MAGNAAGEAGRPAIAILMADPERSAVDDALTNAGFDTIQLMPGTAIAEAFSSTNPTIVAVVDVASGVPVKGLTVGYNKLTATMTAPGAAGSKVTGTDGRGTGTSEMGTSTRMSKSCPVVGGNGPSVTTPSFAGNPGKPTVTEIAFETSAP